MTETMKRILSLMEEKNITAYKLEKDIGISQANFSLWKKGRGSPKEVALVKLADYFDVSTDYLLGRTPYKRPTDNPDLVWGYGTLDRDLTPDELEQVKSYVEMMDKAHDSEKKDK